MSGIYIASKVRHADLWKAMRSAGYPIISTWIDEAGEGETADHHDLWDRCIREASTCSALVVYREAGETLKGAWIEMGAALSAGRPVFAVGIEEFTVAAFRRIQHFGHVNAAFAAAMQVVPAEASIARCPRCQSPDPKRHPAVQFEGEVHVCPHPFHATPTLLAKDGT